MSAWAGRALVGAFAVFFGLQVVYARRHWHELTHVSTPRGTDAPDLTLPLLDGGELHVAGERGHPLVLAFFASWCGPCMTELPGVDRVAQRLAADKRATKIIAVNTEGSRDAALETRMKLGITLPIALDDGSASQRYKVMTIPHIVILDGDGKIADVLRGVHSEGDVERAIAAVENSR
jgi:peroxiredoxin